MSSTIVGGILLGACVKVPLIMWIIYNLWLLVIHPLVRWVVGWIAWGMMWELSALAMVEFSTVKCRRRNGGRLEMYPERLNFDDWVLHQSCNGRVEGSDEIYSGITVLLCLAGLFILVSGKAGTLSRHIRVLRVTYLRLESVMYIMVDFILALSTLMSASYVWALALAELSLVSKPVGPSQGVLVDSQEYDQLVKGKKQLEGKISELQIQIVPLEQIVQWCKSWHADPDACKMKSLNALVSRNQRELDDLRPGYSRLQQANANLRSRLDNSRIAELESDIRSKESEILALQSTIAVMEARPVFNELKSEKEKNAILELKIDHLTRDSDAQMIKAAQSLSREEKLEAKVSGTEVELGTAREEAKAALESVRSLQQKLQTTQSDEVAHRAELRHEVESMRAHLQTRFEEELLASHEEMAEAAEAAFNARVEESVSAQMKAALKESAEAAEADINSRVEAQLAARVAEAMAEKDAATEAAIKSRVDEQIAHRIIEAMAEKAEADAAAEVFDFGDFEDEFNAAVEECLEMAKAREIEAQAVNTSNPTAGTNEDMTMSNDAPAPAATNFSFGGPVAFMCAAPKKTGPVVRGAPARKRAKGPESRSFAPEQPCTSSVPILTPAAPVPAPVLTTPSAPARPQSLWKLRPIRPRGERPVNPGVGAAGPSGSAEPSGLAVPSGSTGPPGTPSDVAPGAVGGRRRASGRVVPSSASPLSGIPGLGQLPASEVARARAQEEEAAAHVAFSLGKFREPERPDPEKPYQGVRERDPDYYLEDSDQQWY